MDQYLRPTPQPDYHQYDHAWQLGAPDLEPQPGQQDAPGSEQAEGLPPAPPGVLPPYRPPQGEPGAIRNPCCMGSEAMDMLGVLTGFVEAELADQRCYQSMYRRAPGWARQSLRELAEQAGEHTRRLLSACYLINGRCYQPVGTTGPVYMEGWCRALRERYHTTACSGLNYARAADGTGDPCLRELLLTLSREEYHQAERVMELLQRSL